MLVLSRNQVKEGGVSCSMHLFSQGSRGANPERLLRRLLAFNENLMTAGWRG